MLPSLIAIICFVSPFKEEIHDKKEELKPRSALQIASFWLISLHQNFLTKIDGPRSNFSPCSSTYMKEAIKKHGFFMGSLYGLDRLIRENKDPWIYHKKPIDDETSIKLDPVP